MRPEAVVQIVADVLIANSVGTSQAPLAGTLFNLHDA